MKDEKSPKEKLKSTESIKPFAVVHAESGYALIQDNLVPISEDYNRSEGEDKENAFRLLPREFATNLLKFEANSMIPETHFTKAEKEVLDDFAKKNYVKSAKVAGITVYFDLNSKIRRYLINILQRRN
jgi:hypothetical protein